MRAPLSRGLLVLGATALLTSCQDRAARLPESRMPDPLPAGQARSSLSFSPDGKRLAWFQTRSDTIAGLQLWVGNTDFSDARILPVVDGTNELAPLWSPDGTRLVVYTRDLKMTLVPVDGGDALPLARAAGVQQPLAWHPDGDRVAYASTAAGGRILTRVVSVRTGESAPLIPGAPLTVWGIGWSPDGSMIAYNETDGDRSTIWVADSTGGDRRQLTTEGFEGPVLGGAWSPDGKSLLYTSNRTGKSDLWTIPVDGGPPRQLTSDIAADFGGAWSSDGRWVAFVSERGRQRDVWVVSAAGGDARRVTNSKEVENPPRWRPGTNELLFTDFTARRSLVRIDVADGAERDLLGDSLLVDTPTLSKDGRLIAVTVGRGGGNRDLLLVPSEGGPIRTLVTSGGNIVGVSWSPDGSQIAYASDLRGNPDISVVDVASAAVRQVTDWVGFEGNPEWNRTGSALYFVANRASNLNDVWAVPSAGGEPRRITQNQNVVYLLGGAGSAEFFVGLLGQREIIGLSRMDADGSLHTVFDRSNVQLIDASPLGDSVVVTSVRGGGAMAPMLMPIGGGAGRPILSANQTVMRFAPDGRRLVYGFRAGGQQDLGILDLRDGSRRELARTPANEALAQWLPDGKAIVARRSLPTTRVILAELSPILGVAK